MSRTPWLLVVLVLAGAPPARAADGGPDERALQGVGLATDGPALLEFFRAQAEALDVCRAAGLLVGFHDHRVQSRVGGRRFELLR